MSSIVPVDRRYINYNLNAQQSLSSDLYAGMLEEKLFTFIRTHKTKYVKIILL